MLKYAGAALLAGYAADLIFGDPRWLYHPVRLIGNLIALLEKLIRKIMPVSKAGELAGGFITVVLVLLLCGIVPWVLLHLVFGLNVVAGVILEAFMCYQLLAVKSLKDESMKVYDALTGSTIEDARKAVSMIVGRDTQNLDQKGVAKAAIETVAENFSDGVIAPMFYMFIGGPVLMYIYKGINTMDSMLGYKNDRYIYFGRCAAKLDDAANFIPSRLAALLLIAAAYIGGFNGKGAVKIFKRDRFNHASPNSAQTESAAAGALDIQLAGNAYYFGKLYEKPTMGDSVKEPEAEDIKRVNKLMYIGSFAGAAVFALLHFICAVLIF
ncbi:MAG: adenosylcobinamide-phosphate synthase CbiB [Anaerovoracaceae bacterium]